MFVVWCSGLPGASARPGLSPFVFVVVFGVSFVGLRGFCSPWGVRLLSLRGCVGVCLLALWGFCLLCCGFSSSWWLPLAWVLRLLVAGAWRSEASACPGCLCSFCWLRLVFAFLALWGFCRPGVFVLSLTGCGLWSGFVFWRSGASARPGVFVFFPWVVVLVFVFWRFGASACGEVSFCFLFWWFCPSVVSLFFLVAGSALSFVAGRCCWCFSFGALWLLPALGCVWFGGWGRCLLIGALGLLPALG